MIFAFLFYSDERAIAAMSPQQRNTLVERHTAYPQLLRDAGATVLDTRGLNPSATAVTVRPGVDPAPGPAAHGDHALAGIYLVDCADLGAAVALARRYPMPDGLGSIEVRPVMARWDYTPTAVTAAAPPQVWRRYVDVASWPRWMVGVRAAALDGPFVAGATGTLTPAGRPPVPLRIVSADPPWAYISETELVPGGVLRIEHELAELPGGGTRITHRVNVPRAVLDGYGLGFAPELYDGMRRTIEALARTAGAGGGPWRVTVAADRCTGSGVCAGLAPDHFTVDAGRSRPSAAAVDPDPALLDAAQCCPMEAIAVTDASGTAVRVDDVDQRS